MTTQANPPTYRIDLRPMPDSTDPDGIRRLRRALKCLGRSFRLRCVRAEELKKLPNGDTCRPSMSEVDNAT